MNRAARTAGAGRMHRLGLGMLLLLAMVTGLVVFSAQSASAHILPTTTVVLDVHESEVDASLRIPLDDIEAASGIDLGSGSAAEVAAQEDALRAYILAHFQPTSTSGQAWTVTVDTFGSGSTEELGTGVFGYITAVAHLTPPPGLSERDFELGYTVVVDKEITHIVIVSVRSDWASGALGTTRELGTIRLDTVTGVVSSLEVDLGDGSAWTGFVSMVSLGVDHIRDGVDHQLFLLTLLLPAPLLSIRRRWAGVVTARRSVRRIATITLSFTVGHSITLALGALGLPVPQQAVEALIAVSILVAAVHALRPIFPGREALIAGIFGLVHGMAFSATLTELDLSGGQLALSLLGFNIGIELMQLAVVALVLPPLMLLARTRLYRPLRLGAAGFAGIAAAGWLAARLGLPNPVADVADGLEGASFTVVAVLWLAAVVVVTLHSRAESRARVEPAGSGGAGSPSAPRPVAGGFSRRDSAGLARSSTGERTPQPKAPWLWRAGENVLRRARGAWDPPGLTRRSLTDYDPTWRASHPRLPWASGEVGEDFTRPTERSSTA
ncbi:hypothetical protein B7R21_15675 [Subtercola boreus]|uniref:HupE / UreJ protein n=1 Tax=Subtercola boreus TaxID=120213 RepID=A0A3E0VFH9_9MICO|nr:HupE/UreJ family protein [Subtercola boreus]RFA07617.1 hypothetical protein B7R21_15675 [Subtercola boreus]